MEPRPARWAPCRQRASRGRSHSRRAGRQGTGRREATAPASGMEVVFLPSPSLHDGRYANDGWLQELPDPLTKLTWDNPALVEPEDGRVARPRERGLGPHRLLRPFARAPRWLLPGMADGLVAVTLGYGRSHAGRIGSGVGFDAFTVRRSTAPGFDSGVSLTKLERTYPAVGDPGARQHGGAPRRARVDPGRGSSEGCRRWSRSAKGRTTGGREAAARARRRRIRTGPSGTASALACSPKTRSTSLSGRSIPTIRGTSGG